MGWFCIDLIIMVKRKKRRRKMDGMDEENKKEMGFGYGFWYGIYPHRQTRRCL